tara:strand:- start:237270 stop:238154 length:885 start_codon:yes stop_codon:yes gene_type:complete
LKLIKISPIQKKIIYKKPVNVAGKIYNEREIFELEVYTDHGTTHTELSLIDNLHQSTYREALNSYINPENFINWHREIKYPIEAALFQISQPGNRIANIRVNSYLDPSIERKSIHQEHTYKVKIGRGSIDSDVELLKGLEHKCLRLDANRTLSSPEFEKYLQVLENYDYFEEPFSDIKDYNLFPNERFALDENIENLELQKLTSVKAFVIKPSLLGLEKTLQLIKTAKNLGKRVVISSTFEGEIGHLSLGRIASYSDNYLGYREEHGLGTISFLSDSLKIIGICVVKNGIELKF